MHFRFQLAGSLHKSPPSPTLQPAPGAPLLISRQMSEGCDGIDIDLSVLVRYESLGISSS